MTRLARGTGAGRAGPPGSIDAALRADGRGDQPAGGPGEKGAAGISPIPAAPRGRGRQAEPPTDTSPAKPGNGAMMVSTGKVDPPIGVRTRMTEVPGWRTEATRSEMPSPLRSVVPIGPPLAPPVRSKLRKLN